jgi:hypothetical protein
MLTEDRPTSFESGFEPNVETRDRCSLLLVMRSGHVHRVPAEGRKVAAESKPDAD